MTKPQWRSGVLREPTGSLVRAARLCAWASLAYDDLPVGRRTEESCLSRFRFRTLRDPWSGGVQRSPPNMMRDTNQAQDFDTSVPGIQCLHKAAAGPTCWRIGHLTVSEGLKDVGSQSKQQKPNAHTHTHPLQLYLGLGGVSYRGKTSFFLKGLCLTEIPL